MCITMIESEGLFSIAPVFERRIPMIFDRIHCIEHYLGDNAAVRVSSGMARAFEHMRDTDLSGLDKGQHELGDGVFVNVMSYQTRGPEDVVWEAHREYIDVQVVLSGRERVLWVGLDEGLTVTTPYGEKGDAVLFAGEDDGGGLVLEPGRFAVFYPQDVHAPSLRVGEQAVEVHKAVYKVPVGG